MTEKTAKPASVVVLISGRGSNLKALFDNAQDFKVVRVISNNSQAPGLVYAHDRGVETEAYTRANFSSLKDFKRRIFEAVKTASPNLVLLAGFMQVLEAEFVEYFKGRLINIHPSLLPEFKGLSTHKAALAAGAKLHGCTVHFVDAGVDTGPIIAQASCPCYPEADSEDTLAARVLELEHKLYPWVVNALARGEISLLPSGSVNYSERVVGEARRLNFILNNSR